MGVNSTKCAVGETPVTQNNKIDQSAEVRVFCWGWRTSVRTAIHRESPEQTAACIYRQGTAVPQYRNRIQPLSFLIFLLFYFEVFRSLQRATKGSAFRIRHLLKKVDENFCFCPLTTRLCAVGEQGAGSACYMVSGAVIFKSLSRFAITVRAAIHREILACISASSSPCTRQAL